MATLTKSFFDSGSGFLSGWLHSATNSKKWNASGFYWMSNVVARTEIRQAGREGKGREGTHCLRESL